MGSVLEVRIQRCPRLLVFSRNSRLSRYSAWNQQVILHGAWQIRLVLVGQVLGWLLSMAPGSNS